MIKLLASDLDGTIVYNNKITEVDLKAVQKLKEEDIKFVICTGKTYAMTKDICNELMPSYGIFGNGTQIIDMYTGKEIIKNSITIHQAIQSLKIAEKHKLHMHIYTDDSIVAQENLSYMAYRNYILYKNKLQIETVNSLEKYIKEKRPNILKLVISGEQDLIEIKEEIEARENVTAIQIKKYGEYKDDVIDKEYEYLDIVPKDTTKYQAIKQLSTYLNIPLKDMMAIGDNINDIEMIRHVGIGIAIAGSFGEVKEVATYITINTVKTGGFAEAVDKFIDEKRREYVYSRRV